MKFIDIKAPAKINIGLDILSKRDDGFHNLTTLFYPIHDLYDTLLIERSEKFEFVCKNKNVPDDDTNLVVKAKKLLENFTKKNLPAKIELIKRIPSQAGLGGGSSDAAAALISLNEMFTLGIKYETLLNLALELGSDVPFFLKSKPSIGSSRGEILEPVNLLIENPILIINPGINISTRNAFAQIVPKNKPTNFKSIIHDGRLNYSLASEILKNDFENTVFSVYPEIEYIKKTCLDAGALISFLSGSGSTVFAFFEDEKDAQRVQNLLPSKYFVHISLQD